MASPPGTIVDLAAWRERRAGDAPLLERVEVAIRLLNERMAERGWRTAPPWLLTEVRAIQGCLAVDELAEAAARAERLCERLSERPQRTRIGR